jgi:hypothetical protein
MQGQLAYQPQPAIAASAPVPAYAAPPPFRPPTNPSAAPTPVPAIPYSPYAPAQPIIYPTPLVSLSYTGEIPSALHLRAANAIATIGAGAAGSVLGALAYRQAKKRQAEHL